MFASMRGEIDAALEVAAVERRLLVGESRLRPMVELAHGVTLVGVDHWRTATRSWFAWHTGRRVSRATDRGSLRCLADAALRTRHVQDGERSSR